MTYRWAFTFISWLLCFLGIFLGAYSIFITRKVRGVHMPAGVIVEEYHKWLMTGASDTDVREFAVAADRGDSALLNVVLILAFWLIVVGIIKALFLGMDC